MKKFLRAGLFFACLASPSVFTAGESVATKAVAGFVGLTLASTILKGKALPSAGILAAFVISKDLRQFWKPVAAGFVCRLAFEEESIKKCLTKIRDGIYLSLMGAGLFVGLGSTLIHSR